MNVNSKKWVLFFSILIMTSHVFSQISMERFAKIQGAVFSSSDKGCEKSLLVSTNDPDNIIIRPLRDQLLNNNQEVASEFLYVIDQPKSLKEIFAKNTLT
jgi:hypothetical protein